MSVHVVSIIISEVRNRKIIDETFFWRFRDGQIRILAIAIYGNQIIDKSIVEKSMWPSKNNRITSDTNYTIVVGLTL